MSAALTNATKRFGAVLAVDDVTFDVGPGELVGLLGANGAGKTTSIRMLLGLTPTTSGDVRLFGSPPSRETVRRVGYVPQGLGLYTDLTGAENMAFQAGVFGFDPGDPPHDLRRWWQVPVGEMPLGVRRRVAFEVAFAHQPELLILDEPTSGVGPLGRARLWDTIHQAAEAGTGVLVTTHYLEEAEQCDRLIMMAGGRVVATGRLEDIIGGATTVEVRAPDWAAAATVLEEAGEAVTLVGAGLRLPGSEPERVREVLRRHDVTATVGSVPSSLDETFVRLAG